MSPKRNYFWLWRHQDTSMHTRKVPNRFKQYYVWGSRNIENRNLSFCWERRVSNIYKDSSYKFLRILNTRSISIKKHEMNMLANVAYGINIFQKTWHGNLVIPTEGTWTIESGFMFNLRNVIFNRKEPEHLSFWVLYSCLINTWSNIHRI